MVREILQIAVGHCGNMVGQDFWKNISFEYNLDEYGNCTYYDNARMEKIDTYFHETSTHSYKPRALLVDTETDTLDSIKASPINNMFISDHYLYGNGCSTLNNWGKGYYTIGSEIKDEINECIRREIEEYESLLGFQMIHSLGGGTGSGLATLILLYLRDDYPDRITSNYCIFPAKTCAINIAPYNVVLSLHQLIENSDYTVIFDNQSLFNISQNILNIIEPKFSDINWLISLAMNGSTAPLRYRGTYNDDLRKRCVNLIPFPRLHFFTCSHAPFFKFQEGAKLKLTVQDITDELWSNNNILTDIDHKNGKCLSSLCIYRRDLVDLEMNYKIIEYFLRKNDFIDRTSLDIIKMFLKYYTFGDNKGVLPDYTEIFKSTKNLSSDHFISWIPQNLRTSFIEIPPHNTSQSATMITSTTAIISFLQRIVHGFNTLFNDGHKLLHLYLNEGMDQMEFQEASINVRDLITEYDDKQNASVELYDYDYDEDYDEMDYNNKQIEYDMNIVNQLASFGLGTQNDIKNAMDNVVNSNDINEIANYLVSTNSNCD